MFEKEMKGVIKLTNKIFLERLNENYILLIHI